MYFMIHKNSALLSLIPFQLNKHCSELLFHIYNCMLFTHTETEQNKIFPSMIYLIENRDIFFKMSLHADFFLKAALFLFVFVI